MKRFTEDMMCAIGEVMCLVLVLTALGLLISTCAGCSSFHGRPTVKPVALFGSESRHNVQGEAGCLVEWKHGASIEATAGRRVRIEEPSTRGDTAEYQFHIKYTGKPFWGN